MFKSYGHLCDATNSSPYIHHNFPHFLAVVLRLDEEEVGHDAVDIQAQW